MATLDLELLRRFRYLSLLAQRAAARSLVAPHGDRLSGVGTEVVGLRDYSPGDDYRYVDWAISARRDELLVRVFEGNEDRRVDVLLDCSPSMGLGNPPKFRLARQIAAVLAYSAVNDLVAVCVTAFSDGIVARGPAIRDSAQIGRLLRFLGQVELQGTQTDLTKTAERFVRGRRAGPVLVISDLYAPSGFRRGFDVLRGAGFELRVVRVFDPAETTTQLLGDVELVDAESGTARRVTVTEKAAERYRELYAKFRRSIDNYCAKHGLVHLEFPGDAREDEVLLRVLGVETRASLETT